MANILRTLSAPQMASVYCRPSVSRATMYNSKSWKMASSGLLSRVIEARGAFQVSVCFSQRRSFASDADIPPQRPKMLPEFDLTGKICIVSGAAQGLGLTQAEALLEAGATGKLSLLTFSCETCSIKRKHEVSRPRLANH